MLKKISGGNDSIKYFLRYDMDTIQVRRPPQCTNGIENNVLLAEDLKRRALEHNVHFSGDPER